MRIFLALELPECLHKELKDALGYLQRRSSGGINWVAPQNLHLTVNFIGDAPEHLAGEMAAGIQELLSDFSACQLKAEGLELFPAKNPRLLWLKLSAPDSALQKLNRRVLSVAQALGMQPDIKNLKLHVTLGRIKSPQSPVFERSALEYQIQNTELLRWDTLSLYRSTLSPKGAIYNVIQQYHLE